MKKIEKDNLLVIIVTYNPENPIDKLLNSVSLFSNNIIIVDNGSRNLSKLNNTVSVYPNVRIIPLNRNLGVAAAINKGIKEGLSKEIEYIITFDQDSIPSNKLISYYNKVIIKEPNIGLIGCGYGYKVDDNSHITYHDEKELITSGMLHSVNTIKKIGYYNEKLFIDYVDTDYSLRCAREGFRTIKVENCLNKHNLGSQETVNFMGSRKLITTHSANRQYYITRNLVYLTKKYFMVFPSFMISKNYLFLKALLRIILVEPSKKDKLRNTFKGLLDGIRNRMGSFNEL